jgi:antitoxin (DNA-binding transcriptional repressor) of toxin-antitoxin stability system
MNVPVSEATGRSSEMLDRLAIGDEVVITDEGEPIAKLVRIKTTGKKRGKFKFGSAKGEFTVSDNFNDPLPKEIEDLFWK